MSQPIQEQPGVVAEEFLPKIEYGDNTEDPAPELVADYERKREAVERAVATYETPFHLYDERGIRAAARRLNEVFSWEPGYREYFAVKALPNPHVLEILREEGDGADCSSKPEIILSEFAGITGDSIMFTANHTKPGEYRRAAEAGAIINFDDLVQIDRYKREVGPLPELACLRYNPGPLKQGNRIIGNPEEGKFGIPTTQLVDGYKALLRSGVKRLGLHAMVVSNELEAANFAETARLLYAQVARVAEELGQPIEFVNLGGGFGIPYRPGQRPLDIEHVSRLIQAEYEAFFSPETGAMQPSIYTEMGRYITGPHGVLVTKLLDLEQKYREIAGVDSTMADLMRPGMYEAYHHVSVLGGQNRARRREYDVVGSLCEGNDKFAIQRELPELEEGDILVIHDTGAHGRAMGFNYNGKLRCAEILLRDNGTLQEIRRPETIDDYFATLELPPTLDTA